MNVIKRMDMWLLLRVFMRFSHWVDWRFHRNQYDLAAYILSAAIAMNLAEAAQAMINNWRSGWMNAISSACFAVVYYTYLHRLHKASAAYECRPDKIPHDAACFIFTPSPMRLGILFIGLWLWSMFGLLAIVEPRAGIIIEAVTSGWLLLIGCAWYIASGLPPTRDRKKQQQRAPTGAALAMVRI